MNPKKKPSRGKRNNQRDQFDTMRLCTALSGIVLLLNHQQGRGFLIDPSRLPVSTVSSTSLWMALDNSMKSRLDGIRRSYQALTERLGDPDVINDNKLLQKVMSDRSQIEEVVTVYDEYCGLTEELAGAKELFQDAGDDPELKEMARAEIKGIEPKLEQLEGKMKVLLLPKDPNDDRNIMLEIRAGTGGSEAAIFAGTVPIFGFRVGCCPSSRSSTHFAFPWAQEICWMSIANFVLPMVGKRE